MWLSPGSWSCADGIAGKTARAKTMIVKRLTVMLLNGIDNRPVQTPE